MTRGAGGFTLRPRDAQLQRIAVPPSSKPHLDQYRKLLEDIAGSEVTERLAGLRLRDEDDPPPLQRILGDTFTAGAIARRAAASRCRRSISACSARLVDYAEHFRDFERPLGLRAPAAQRLHVYTQVEPHRLDTCACSACSRKTPRRAARRRRDRSRRSVCRARLARGERRRGTSLDLLPSVLGGADRRADLRGRRLRERRAQGHRSTASQRRYRVRPRRDLRAEGRDNCSTNTAATSSARTSAGCNICSSTAARPMRGGCAAGVARGLALCADQEADARGRRGSGCASSIRGVSGRSRSGRSGQVLPGVENFCCRFAVSGRNYGKVFRQLLVETTRRRREQKRRVVILRSRTARRHIDTCSSHPAQAAGVPRRHRTAVCSRPAAESCCCSTARRSCMPTR